MSNETRNYEEGTILHNVRADKYTAEVKETFIIETKDTDWKINIKRESMLEMAESFKENSVVSQLLNNGYPSSGKMSAGAGKAFKGEKTEDSYECIFYEGEIGVAFDSKKIQAKKFIKLNKEHLDAILTFLLLNEKIALQKAEEKKIQRTTLELD